MQKIGWNRYLRTHTHKYIYIYYIFIFLFKFIDIYVYPIYTRNLIIHVYSILAVVYIIQSIDGPGKLWT